MLSCIRSLYFSFCVKIQNRKKNCEHVKIIFRGKNKKQELTRIKRFYITLTMNIENFIPKIAI